MSTKSKIKASLKVTTKQRSQSEPHQGDEYNGFPETPTENEIFWSDDEERSKASRKFNVKGKMSIPVDRRQRSATFNGAYGHNDHPKHGFLSIFKSKLTGKSWKKSKRNSEHIDGREPRPLSSHSVSDLMNVADELLSSKSAKQNGADSELPAHSGSLRNLNLSSISKENGTTADGVSMTSLNDSPPPLPPRTYEERCYDQVESIKKSTPSEYDRVLDCPHDMNGVPSITSELQKLSKYGWYWGPLSRTEAEVKLNHCDDGSFLVRDSSDDHYLLSLSFRCNKRTLHTRIEHCNGVFSFYAQPGFESHKSIIELIENSMSDSFCGVFCYSRATMNAFHPQIPVRLSKPVSRFTEVRSLQYLCRFVIRQRTRFDLIQQLPVPRSIKSYLEERPY